MTPKANATSLPPKWVRGYVGFLARHDLWISLGAFVLFILAVIAASRLELRSDFTELLPQDTQGLLHERFVESVVPGVLRRVRGETRADRESYFGKVYVSYRPQNPCKPFGDRPGKGAGCVLHPRSRGNETTIPRQRPCHAAALHAPPKPNRSSQRKNCERRMEHTERR